MSPVWVCLKYRAFPCAKDEVKLHKDRKVVEQNMYPIVYFFSQLMLQKMLQISPIFAEGNHGQRAKIPVVDVFCLVL